MFARKYIKRSKSENTYREDDHLSSSLSLMSLASALPHDSTYRTTSASTENIQSNSEGEFNVVKSFKDEVEYSDYDFEEDEDETCNAPFDIKLLNGIMENMQIIERKRYKNGTRSSLTFSNQRVKEIERDNRVLLMKIMRNGPSGDLSNQQKLLKKNQQPKIKSAAEINRLRKQKKIIHDNQILKRKLEKISSRQSTIPN